VRALASAFFVHLDATIGVPINPQYHIPSVYNNPRIRLGLLAEYIPLTVEQSHQNRLVLSLSPSAAESPYPVLEYQE